MRKILALSLILFASAAFAADNAVIVTPGSGVTMASKDIGAGVQSMKQNLIDQAGAEILGQVTASPTANTIGARLKTIGDALAGTLTVTGAGGTFPATQSGTWTVQPGNTANTTAWLVTGTGGTFPATQSGTWNITNISGTVSLPTGAATAAKQPALGTAGTASSDVITVQGIASMTALLVNPGTAANWAVGATGSAVPANALFVGLSDGTNTRGWLNAANALNSTGGGLGTAQIIGQFDDTTPTSITENQFGNVRISANRNVYTTIRDAAGNERGVNVTASNELSVNCSNCSGSGASLADEGTFTAGSTSFAPSGGFFQTTATDNALTNGQGGWVQMTANRAFMVNIRNASGSELGLTAAPFIVSGSGTAGSAATGVVTVQGIASMTALSVSGASGAFASGAFASGSIASGAIAAGAQVDLLTMRGTKAAGTAAANSILTGGVYNSAGITLTDGQQASTQFDSAGNLKTVVSSGTITTVTTVTNLSQFGGAAINLGAGAVGTGTLRITQASDSPEIAALGAINNAAYTGTGDATVIAALKGIYAAASGSVPAGSALIGDVNVRLGGTAASTNNGTAGAQVQRVAIASDNSAVSGMGVGATGSAAPANANYVAGNGSGATGGLLVGLKTCDSHAKYEGSDTGKITMVTGVSGRKVYICGFIMATGATATDLTIVEGSDANCATSEGELTPTYVLSTNDRIGALSSFWTGMVTSTNAYYVCIKASAANSHQAEVWYTIQ